MYYTIYRMDTLGKREVGVIIALAVLLVVSIIPALLDARREARDGAQRDALAAVKRKLEDVNNKIGYHSVDFDASPFMFVVTQQSGKQALGWYVRAELEQNLTPLSGFDFEGEHNFYYRVSRENGQTFYDICGGNDTCGGPKLEGH